VSTELSFDLKFLRLRNPLSGAERQNVIFCYVSNVKISPSHVDSFLLSYTLKPTNGNTGDLSRDLRNVDVNPLAFLP